MINTGKVHPSQESRAHVVWDEKGLITVTGGKLTTFRIMAAEALNKASPFLTEKFSFEKHPPLFTLPSYDLSDFDSDPATPILSYRTFW